MIPKSVQRFSEKIMLKQRAEAECRFEEKSSRFGLPGAPAADGRLPLSFARSARPAARDKILQVLKCETPGSAPDRAKNN
ncbi:MAG: hypothetical protein F9K38_15610, partial [Pseudorhodoplanes sp.]